MEFMYTKVLEFLQKLSFTFTEDGKSQIAVDILWTWRVKVLDSTWILLLHFPVLESPL